MRLKIIDEFTDTIGRNGKPLSRQRLHQKRKQHRGTCEICTDDAVDGSRCEKHKIENAIRNRERARKKLGFRHRYRDSKYYQPKNIAIARG